MKRMAMCAVTLVLISCAGRACVGPPEYYPLDRARLRQTLVRLRAERPGEDAGKLVQDRSFTDFAMRDPDDRAIEIICGRWSGLFVLSPRSTDEGFHLRVVTPNGEITNTLGAFRRGGEASFGLVYNINDKYMGGVREEWLLEAGRWRRSEDPLELAFGPLASSPTPAN